MYEPTRKFDSFFIAGFQHHEGAFVLRKLKAGKKLDLVPEPDNPYDPCAIAIKYKGTHLGYVPRCSNQLLAQMMHYGYQGAFECCIMQVDAKADPWEQVRVGLYLVDNRGSKVE